MFSRDHGTVHFSLRSFRWYLVTVRLWRGLIARSDYCLVQTSRTGIIIREKEQKTGAGGKQDQRRSKTKAWNRKEREEQAAGRISSIYVQEPSTEDSKIRNQGTDNESNQEQATRRESWIANRDNRHQPYGKLSPLPQPTKPWRDITFDFIPELPPSKGRGSTFDSVFVIVSA